VIAVAGCVDAIAWRHFSKICVSFMSGNSTSSCIHGARGEWTRLASAAAPALPGAGSTVLPALLLLAFAMGALNCSISTVGSLDVSLTFVTGTVVSMGRGLAEALLERGRPFVWTPHLGLWGGLMAGTVAGAVPQGCVGLSTLLAPASAVGLLAGLTLRRDVGS
jgi:uncharacterized membrane protein YoaK (UPF0700 family)